MIQDLKRLIKQNNLNYEFYNQLIENSKSEEELFENKTKRKQFIKDYATFGNNFLI